jgi:hypothetical protein
LTVNREAARIASLRRLGRKGQRLGLPFAFFFGMSL